MKRLCLLFIALVIGNTAFSQRSNYWVFGDSLGVNFNTSPPTIDSTRIIQSVEASACISDLYGNLLFYVAPVTKDPSINLGRKFIVRMANDSIMLGGDSLAGWTSTTQGALVLPSPSDTNEYYIFHNDAYHYGKLLYSKVNMSLNGGNGAVVNANTYTGHNYLIEKLSATKAANGKDWWIISYKANFQNFTSGYCKFKLDSSGMHHLGYQYDVNSGYSGGGQMLFSPNGDKMLSCCADSLFLYDFDRCTGLISNPQLLYRLNWDGYYGASFSASGRYLYASSYDSLWQFDTQAPNITASRTFLYSVKQLPLAPDYIFGQHMLAPDNKIYITIASNNPVPITDSIVSHLSVINYPDSVGANCSFTLNSISLSPRRSYGGLPNFVNYNLGPIENLNCDSILAADVRELNVNNVRIMPNPTKGLFNIEFPKELIDNYAVKVYSISGQFLAKEENRQEFDISALNSGIYIVEISTDKQVYRTKVVKE